MNTIRQLFNSFQYSFVDDIIKQNRAQRRNERKKKPTSKQNQGRTNSLDKSRNSKNDVRYNRNKKMMDTTPVKSTNVQKQRGQQREGKIIIRSNSGKPHFDRTANRNKRSSAVATSTPGLRQPWEKLPQAPLPAEPLKISIRNELADRPLRRSSEMAIDSEPSSHYRSAVAYEPREALASREEYRIGNRFATQGMAIDYQLPSGASFDTRPSRRY